MPPLYPPPMPAPPPELFVWLSTDPHGHSHAHPRSQSVLGVTVHRFGQMHNDNFMTLKSIFFFADSTYWTGKSNLLPRL
jgi:hypothetical protein